ncbi:hypothetical protein [Paenibacillus glucanolyticus]|nr:hypothetical protein [Paenibacillus glucanolyticus]
MNSMFVSKESIENDTARMVIQPLTQLHDRLKELKEMNHDILQGVDEIYLMAVTLGEFPTSTPLRRYPKGAAGPFSNPD